MAPRIAKQRSREEELAGKRLVGGHIFVIEPEGGQVFPDTDKMTKFVILQARLVPELGFHASASGRSLPMKRWG